MDTSCVFCKISKGEVPAEIVDQTRNFIVFTDANPHAPLHLLLVPKEHYTDISEIPDDLWIEAKNLALRLCSEYRMDGFRFAVNYGCSAHIKHFHVHFLGNIGHDAHM